MINYFEKEIGLLHDARVFGFLFDNNREIFKSDFYMYIQIFGDFDEDRYHMKKSLICFENAEISKLLIKDDISQGQYFVSDLECELKHDGRYEFTFVFNSADIELKLYAVNMKLITSDLNESGSDQYLKTNWSSLLSPCNAQ